MAKKVTLQAANKNARKIREANPKILWSTALKRSWAELKGGTTKKAAVSGTKKPKKAPKVAVRAKTVNVLAGIGCTSKSAMAQMNACISGIAKQEKAIEQLNAKMKTVDAKSKPAYRREIATAKAMLSGLKKAKAAYKKLI